GDHNFGNVDLDISSGFKIQTFSFRQLDHKLLNKGRHVVVGDHFAFPFFNSEYFFRNPDPHVLFYLYLAGKPDLVLLFGPAEMTYLRGKHLTASVFHHASAFTAGTAP